MPGRFTLGIEEEFQLVYRHTGELGSCAQSIIEKGMPYFGEKIKPEMLQSTIELVSDILPSIAEARRSLVMTRALLARFVEREGMALISAGTHAGGRWEEQQVTQGERYIDLEEEYQDMIRSDLIFGLHVHVGIEKEPSIAIMNQVRTWLPHLLALSSNAPFWEGRNSGLKSYRSVLWKRFPRAGVPPVLPSQEHLDRYVEDLVEMGCIDDGKKIWWDVRLHPYFGTIEFRICDMPITIEDTLGIAALCQALVAKLTLLYKRGQEVPVISGPYIEENKWRAMRYGLDAEFADFASRRKLSMRDSIRELLDFVDEVVDDLGSRREIDHVRALLIDPRGTGADRQIALYKRTGDIQAVRRYLMEQTMSGISIDGTSIPDEFVPLLA